MVESHLKSFVHPFSTANNHYLYDANTSNIVLVTKNIYNYYKNNESGHLDDDDIKDIHRMKESGLLKKSPIKEITHPMTKILPDILSRRVENITLQVTQQCNLRCKYCVYSGSYITRIHSSRTMSLETAKKGVDFIVSNSLDLDQINIAFYGGEPLLQFNLIKKVVEYAEVETEGKKVSFGMTTNGTLFNDEILNFLQEKKFMLVISLDGPEEVHDKNRIFAKDGKGTFSTIIHWLRYIKENFSDLYRNTSFNAVIDPKLDIGCASSFFVNCEEIADSAVNSGLIGTSYKRSNEEIPEQFIIADEEEHFKVLLNKLGRLSSKHISKIAEGRLNQTRSTLFHFRKRTAYDLAPINHPGGPCIPGARKLFMDVNGKFFPCESVSESSSCMIIGDIEQGFDLEQAEYLLNVGRTTEEACKTCWSFQMCVQCCLMADKDGHLDGAERLSRCDNVRAQNEDALLDYCSLLEYGYKFSNQEN